MKKAVVFGGGNIGRSFLVPVLQEAGYKVTIADIDEGLITLLNQKGSYPLHILSREQETVQIIRDFDAVSLNGKGRILECLEQADLVSTSVGRKGLPGVCRILAEAAVQRAGKGKAPLDVILAENIRQGAELCRNSIRPLLPHGFPLESHLGFVETSIGKMVPLMSPSEKAENPLKLKAEPYNTLILDKAGFLNTPPEGKSIKLVYPIAPWVDRKLFIHNLGHAAAAYLGRAKYPEMQYIWEVMEDEELKEAVREAMTQSAEALVKEYSRVFSREDLFEHIEDLLYRFSNRALGDTIQRVGRDLPRKLSFSDRIVGAMNLAISHCLPYDRIFQVYKGALQFGLSPDADPADAAVCRIARDLDITLLMQMLSVNGLNRTGI